MRLHGRVLHLLQNPEEIRAQLDGEDLSPPPEASYVYGVNTDAMISGRACTLGYTPDVLGPWFLHRFLETVEREEVLRGGFQVLVGGAAYGSGSSREVAVVAHQGAGVELVLADSFQRIFLENLVYAGLPFSTERDKVLAALHAGEEVDLSALSGSLPALFQQISRAGGLLPYGSQLLKGDLELPYALHREPCGMTIVEKIIARHVLAGERGFGVSSVRPGEQVLVRAAFRGMHEYTAGMCMSLYEEEWGAAPVHRPELVAAFEDHFVLIDHPRVPQEVKNARLGPSQVLSREMAEACEAHKIRVHGPGREGKAGVCHRLVLEEYVSPGDVVILTDSHSPTAGALNAFAFGVGSTAMSFALRTGLIPVTVPKTVRVDVVGSGGGVLSPKDLILHLIGDPYFVHEAWRESDADTCVLEFGGEGLSEWSVDELSVLTNMTVEGGLMSGVVEPCAPVRDFVAERRTPERQGEWIEADSGAVYVRRIKIDLGEVPLTIATPGDSRNRAPLHAHEGEPVHNVVIASCTGGSLEDLKVAAGVLEGKQVANGVRMTVTPSSRDVLEGAKALGLVEIFERAGALLSEPGCGACIGNGPGVPEPGETTVSTTNRNFARRMGAPGPVYLVSPRVAAASALTGTLTDPRKIQ